MNVVKVNIHVFKILVGGSFDIICKNYKFKIRGCDLIFFNVFKKED
jgi:hypothetical protein